MQVDQGAAQRAGEVHRRTVRELRMFVHLHQGLLHHRLLQDQVLRGNLGQGAAPLPWFVTNSISPLVSSFSRCHSRSLSGRFTPFSQCLTRPRSYRNSFNSPSA